MHLRPANIYMSLRIFWTVLFNPKIRALNSYLTSHGLDRQTGLFHVYEDEVPWLSASSQHLDYPLSLPKNVVACGPIFMALDTVENGDPDLHAWLEQGPTVLIVLGSHTKYDDRTALEMAGAIRMVLDSADDDRVQVLWKMKLSRGETEGESGILLEAVSSLLSTGRVRVETWLSVDPASLLESGHISCYVHHGGANSFYEAIG
jgi:hypothetical protein